MITALMYRTCLSLRGGGENRNLSGTAGNLSRLKVYFGTGVFIFMKRGNSNERFKN